MVRFSLVALTCAFAALAAAKNDPKKNNHHDLTPPWVEQDGTAGHCFDRSLIDVMRSWEPDALDVSAFLKCACTTEILNGNDTHIDEYFQQLGTSASYRQWSLVTREEPLDRGSYSNNLWFLVHKRLPALDGGCDQPWMHTHGLRR
ncbi:BZ3500_MvSof-1268-A1-R1_Chr1-1g01176 [Microbotryum saponariae]|uniref:BZ3500_MvSof-1268-A1-R1_Chr1-1g01176 protein n=1 Tax=Microbotryum saponariae TaxID=289078 RepID=A0A2X0L1K5_9BASI|nr:BZ3500_MvSof-1268-A1-R1_Chr1-1g01176 [Microbotryum saponariae]SCZ93580.1 BZ3501_MvSof-1269-A2-R1_Chr1-1g00772 [Microbotryum saponariae]